jgi:hypothetical protein
LYAGFTQRVQRVFELAHQDIRAVSEFPTSLDKALRQLARLPGLLANSPREHRAVV